MYASASDVATNVGRPLSAPEAAQVDQWIKWAQATIRRRLGELAELDPNALNMVIVEAVTRRLKMPEPVTQVSVSVDDANVNKTYQKSTGLIEILPEEWAALGWVDSTPRAAFAVRPHYEPDCRRAWR